MAGVRGKVPSSLFHSTGLMGGGGFTCACVLGFLPWETGKWENGKWSPRFYPEPGGKSPVNRPTHSVFFQPCARGARQSLPHMPLRFAGPSRCAAGVTLVGT